MIIPNSLNNFHFSKTFITLLFYEFLRQMAIEKKIISNENKILIPEIIDKSSLDNAYLFVYQLISEDPSNLKKLDLGYLINRTVIHAPKETFDDFFEKYKELILKKHNLK